MILLIIFLSKIGLSVILYVLERVKILNFKGKDIIMFDFANFITEGVAKDSVVDVSIKCIIEREDMSAYATFISAGKKVGCHSHSKGDEW